MEKKETNIYPTSQNQSDSTKASFFQNNIQQQFTIDNSSNSFANIKVPKNNFLYNKKSPIRNINEIFLSQPQNMINKTNSIINFKYPFNNMKDKNKLGEINQNEIINNQMKINTKVYEPNYRIQKPINSVHNRGTPNEYIIPNMKKQYMPLDQNQLLNLVFHYQNVIDNMNNNINFMKDKFKEYQILNQKQFLSTKQELFPTKQELFSTKQDMKIMDDSFQKKLKDNEMKINKINGNIEQMNELYTKEIFKIKSDFLILNENLNLSTEKENVCLKSIKTILTILDKMIENSENIKQYLAEEIEEKSQDIILLKKEVESLKIRVRELQEFLIGRKLLKILLSKILQSCFISFNITSDENKIFKICNPKLKKKKYSILINVVNKMLKVLFNTNKIIHVENTIHKIIDIINEKTTYADILNICKNSLLPKNEVEMIRKVLEENDLYYRICGNELIEKDKELKALLEEFNRK